MDRKLTNRVTMFKTVEVVLNQNSNVWSGMAPFASAVQELKANIDAIDSTAQKQETPVSGAVQDKLDARDALEDVMFLICQALAVLAHLSNDHDLEALVELTPSRLDKLGGQELANRATTVLARANTMKTELATLQVTQANLDEFSQALAAFETGRAKPRAAVVERAVQTESLPNLVNATSKILRNKIDLMMNLFRRSHPEFVAAYRAARVIIDRGGSKATPKAPPPPGGSTS
jgi:hypothetical protein